MKTTFVCLIVMCCVGIIHCWCRKSAASVLESRKRINILDSYMSYLDTGSDGDCSESSDSGENGEKVVIFLHGNPTQAYLWRNVIPHVKPVARCLAPDLIGMGQSGKIDSMYRFVDHFEYLSAWIDSLELPDKLNFVVHDWGSALGFHWCNLHRDRVQSITFMEGLTRPLSWDEISENERMIFQILRTPAGDEMILQNNFFIEVLMPVGILRNLTNEEIDTYKAPFLEPGESRRPTLTFPREIPIVSEGPEDVVKIATEYNKWLKESIDTPKLYISAEPGFFSSIMDVDVLEFPNTKTVKVKGEHFIQEDSPNEIGKAVKNFILEI